MARDEYEFGFADWMRKDLTIALAAKQLSATAVNRIGGSVLRGCANAGGR